MQIEKNVKFLKPEREIDFKFKGKEIQHQFNVKIVEELENISFLVSGGSFSRVKKEIHNVVEEVQRRNKLIKLADRSTDGWATVQNSLSDDLAGDSVDKK